MIKDQLTNQKSYQVTLICFLIWGTVEPILITSGHFWMIHVGLGRLNIEETTYLNYMKPSNTQLVDMFCSWEWKRFFTWTE